MNILNFEYDPNHWRLLIDSSKTSLKAVKLYNANKLPSVPVAHVSDIKDTSENEKDRDWQVIGVF